MSKLIGNNPNQVPSNADLGTAAFMDAKEFLSARGSNISAIDAIADKTAVHVFIYDTSKDSDGGAWRKRTSHTSWYNEKLNTYMRGSRREFPAVAVIVTESTGVTIYDADDASLPMWMYFPAGNNDEKMLSYNSNMRMTKMLNGIFYSAIGTGGGGLTRINFISEEAYRHRDGSTSYPLSDIGGLTIATRDQAYQYYPNGVGSIGNDQVNMFDVKVVNPDIVDEKTGLPIPKIVVAHIAGTTIIHEDLTTKNTGMGYGTSVVKFDPVDPNVFYFTYSGDHVIRKCDVRNGTYRELGVTYNASNNTLRVAPYTGWMGSQNVCPAKDYVAIRSANYHAFVKQENKYNHSWRANGAVAVTQIDHNTGWMPGDTKVACLSDTKTGMIRGSSNIASNWSTAGDWTKQPSISISWTGSQLSITGNGTGTNVYFYLPINVVPNTNYVINVNLSTSYTTPGWYINTSAYSTSGQLGNIGNTSGAISFNSGSNTVVYLQSYQVNTSATLVDSIDLRYADSNRKILYNDLQVKGNILKSKVAPDADLVCYSGFSNGNQIVQPYNSELEFGTDDWYFMGWIRSRSTSNYSDIIARGNAGDVGWPSSKVGSWFLQLYGATSQPQRSLNLYYRVGTTLASTGWTSVGLPYNKWAHVVVAKVGTSLAIYINGEKRAQTEVGTDTFAITSPDESDTLRIGWQGNSYNYPSVDEDFALFRLGRSSLQDKEIVEYYEDEKHLFEEGAKAVLHGSHNASVFMDYDDYEDILYIATNSAVSGFRGLNRVYETDDGVTNSIAASGGMVVEE